MAFYHFTPDDAKNAIRADIRTREALYPHFETIARTLRRYNGRMYNKRLNDAIFNETDKTVFCREDSYNADIVRCEARLQDARGCTITIFTFRKSELPGNKRIDAKSIINDLKERLTTLYNDVQEMKQARETVDHDVKRINDLRAEADKLAQALPYNVTEYFNIKRWS